MKRLRSCVVEMIAAAEPYADRWMVLTLTSAPSIR